ncbi:MAG: GTPase HflX [Salinisphaeraceae bacterium]|nr:GTPase HflX [Salinisphaeraceae bacterium]
MFERPQSGQRAVLVHLQFPFVEYDEADSEFADLARSCGAQVVARIGGSRSRPDPRYFAGRGKAEEILAAVTEHGAELVVVNHALSPSQERNLESLLKCRVLDRSGLILDVFARRARSHEGKLQVELAQLRHLSTRLVRGWSHLERQKGGIGLRGPGETQLETDRRLLAERIKNLRGRLEKVGRRRAQGRAARRKAETPTVSVVGYTNAGKSTLFNRLTGADIYAADQLFATLDPTLRQLDLPVGDPVILADTVGFIRDLPHELIAAFNATLEETHQASLLLHVVDAANPERQDHVEQVNAVLEDIDARDIPQIIVMNKIDLTGQAAALERDEAGRVWRVCCSAITGQGLDLLMRAVAEQCYPDLIHGELALPPRAAKLRARLFDLGAVSEERFTADGESLLSVVVSRQDLERVCKQEGMDVDELLAAGTRSAVPLEPDAV